MSQLSTLAARTTITFFIFSVLWIAVSDWVVSLFPYELQHILQTSKGWLFVILTSALIYTLLKISSSQEIELQEELQTALHDLSTSSKKKQAILESLPVTVWEQDFTYVKNFIDEVIKPSTPEELMQWMNDNHDGVVMMVDRIKIISLGGPTYENFWNSCRRYSFRA
ncbi:MAG: hypothetical protein ACPGAE_10405 [Neptuniibacter sp.]